MSMINSLNLSTKTEDYNPLSRNFKVGFFISIQSNKYSNIVSIQSTRPLGLNRSLREQKRGFCEF